MVERERRSYEDLDVFKRAFGMLKPVHDLVLKFPDYEKFDLANQMRRACKSIPTNIAEGYARRRSPKEFCSFLAIAVGSANEMEVHVRTAHELTYIDDNTCEGFMKEYQTIGKQLTALIKYWRSVDAAAKG
jgi:four helix bundle protein